MNNPYGTNSPYGGTSDEELARSKAAEEAALRVFGDHQPEPLTGWVLRSSHEFGSVWQSPSRYAATSDEALAEVLAKLEVYSRQVQPVWYGQPKGGRKRVFKARKR